jgi:K+/H+ antiporter YhaU regulatory subunit KhtT
MNLELLGRIHKEVSISGSALYEIILAISERVNRKTQIIRLHWHASTLLRRIDDVAGLLGQEMVDQVARRFLIQTQPNSAVTTLDNSLSHAAAQVQELKKSLLQVDAQIRGLKLEAIHEDLLRLQQDLSLRSARIERLTIIPNAAAIGQSINTMPGPSSVHIVSILRGPFLLAPSDGLVFRPDDIVVLIGLDADLDQCVAWFTNPRPKKTHGPNLHKAADQ